MPSVTSHNSNIQSNQGSLRLDSRVFYEKPSTYSSGSVATERIGKAIDRNIVSVNIIITDDTIGGTTEGPIKILDNSVANDLNSFRYGKDVKFIRHLLNDKLVPNVAIGRSNDLTERNYIDHSIEFNSYGQNSLFKTYDYKKERLIPFDDIEGKPSSKSFIGKNDIDKTGYPYVYTAKRNYDKFRDPDEASLDGAIEVFHVRSSPGNTSNWDLQIKGPRALFGVGNWELTQHSTYGKKGSPLVSERYEIKQSDYDFFEDADESILTNPVEGYISDGLYKSSPFKDVNRFIDNYKQLTNSQRRNLLLSSSRDDSELGTRFKSKNNGFIITPFHQLTEQRSFGTDSISFGGLLKG